MKNENDVKTNENVETATADAAENTKTEKKAATKVAKKTIVVPTTDGDVDTYVTVCINGNITQVKKGEEVEVPEEVYNILKRSGYLGMKIN